MYFLSSGKKILKNSKEVTLLNGVKVYFEEEVVIAIEREATLKVVQRGSWKTKRHARCC